MGVIDLEHEVYAKMSGKTYARSGPGTEYKGISNYQMTGQYLQLISYAYDINERCWVQVAIPTVDGFRYLYVNSSQIDAFSKVKQDVFSEVAYALRLPAKVVNGGAALMAPNPYHGAYEGITLKAGQDVTVIAVAGEYTLIDFGLYTPTDGKVQYRCWVENGNLSY